MSKYDISVKGFGLLLLPTFLRKPVMGALLYALLSPLTYIYSQFRSFQRSCDYRLYHNGQVCYLRALINDQFDPVRRRITITDEVRVMEAALIYERGVNINDPVQMRRDEPGEGEDPRGSLITRRGFGGTTGYDFWVNIPYDLTLEIDMGRLKAIVNAYKLVSKRFGINYI